MLWSSGLHTSGCRVNSNTVQTVLSPWPSGRSKAATVRREQEKEIIVWLPLGMRREQQTQLAHLTELGGAEGLGSPPAQWGAEGEVGLGGGQGRSMAQAVWTCIPDLTPPLARCWRATDKTILWATSWARLTSTWLNFSTMWKSWTLAFWPTSLCWRWVLPRLWGPDTPPTSASALWTLGLRC